MERAQHTHPLIGDDDFDLDETRVQPSVFGHKGGTVVGYPVATYPIAVQTTAGVAHRFDPPLNGYPAAAAYIPEADADGCVIMRFRPIHYDVAVAPDGGPGDADETGIYDPVAHAYYAPEAEQVEAHVHHARDVASQDIASRPADEVWPSARRTPTTGGVVIASEPPPSAFNAPQQTFAETPHARFPTPPVEQRAPLGSPPAYAMAYAQAPIAPQMVPAGAAQIAAAPAAVVAASAAPTERPIRVGRAIIGGMLGLLAGAVLWGGVGFLTGGFEFKYGAIAIGLITGTLAARFGGDTSRTIGLLGAATGVVGLLAGKALFELLVHPAFSMSEHIAYHTTPIDLIFFGATAFTGFAVGSGLTNPRRLLARARQRAAAHIPHLPT